MQLMENSVCDGKQEEKGIGTVRVLPRKGQIGCSQGPLAGGCSLLHPFPSSLRCCLVKALKLLDLTWEGSWWMGFFGNHGGRVSPFHQITWARSKHFWPRITKWVCDTSVHEKTCSRWNGTPVTRECCTARAVLGEPKGNGTSHPESVVVNRGMG